MPDPNPPLGYIPENKFHAQKEKRLLAELATQHKIDTAAPIIAKALTDSATTNAHPFERIATVLENIRDKIPNPGSPGGGGPGGGGPGAAPAPAPAPAPSSAGASAPAPAPARLFWFYASALGPKGGFSTDPNGDWLRAATGGRHIRDVVDWEQGKPDPDRRESFIDAMDRAKGSVANLTAPLNRDELSEFFDSASDVKKQF